MKITIIGTGNVAQILCRLSGKAGHSIVQVAGRDLAKASRLADGHGAKATTDLSALDPVDLYVLAVSDTAMDALARQISLTSGIIAHTAGSVPADVLASCGVPYGVLWPLQSLRANLDRTPDIPWVVAGSDEATRAFLASFARTISDQVGFANDQQRRELHLAAVHGSNFINQLLVQLQDYCRDKGLDFNLLIPLLSETVNRISEAPARELRTGPSARGDQATIDLHRSMLLDRPDMLEVYDVMTRSILRDR